MDEFEKLLGEVNRRIYDLKMAGGHDPAVLLVLVQLVECLRLLRRAA